MSNDAENSIEKLGLDVSSEKRIMDYVNTIRREYKVPLDGIKEIPLNLKGNERYFAIFYYGTLYSKTFFKMTDEEKVIFLSYLIEEPKVRDDAIDYLTKDIISVGNGAQFSIGDIIKIINSEFTEKEKHYMLFSYGLLFVYR